MSSSFTVNFLKTTCILVLLTIYIGKQKHSYAEKQSQVNITKYPINIKVVIATVACSAKTKSTHIYEEALVMLKSVLLSATVNNVDELELHVFLEDLRKQSYFVHAFKKFGFPPNESMVTLFFHSAKIGVPEKYSRHLNYHPRFECDSVRAFLPNTLPTVDAILYLDAEIIITGDILKLWSHLYDMKENQLIGVGYSNEEEDKKNVFYDETVYENALDGKAEERNTGVVLMNLTKMREYEWEEKLLNLYSIYSEVSNPMTVQRLINMLLYYNPGLFYFIGCEFNFIHNLCERGLTCQRILDDPVGIHLVHGTISEFENNGIFQIIYEAYNKFNMTEGDVLHDLYYRIRRKYESRKYFKSLCYRLLAQNLFKDV